MILPFIWSFECDVQTEPFWLTWQANASETNVSHAHFEQRFF